MSAASGPPVPSWYSDLSGWPPPRRMADEGSQALANSRLLDLWVVAPYPGARVYAVGRRRGPSPEGVHSQGSDHSTPSWQATVTSVSLLSS